MWEVRLNINYKHTFGFMSRYAIKRPFKCMVGGNATSELMFIFRLNGLFAENICPWQLHYKTLHGRSFAVIGHKTLWKYETYVVSYQISFCMVSFKRIHKSLSILLLFESFRGLILKCVEQFSPINKFRRSLRPIISVWNLIINRFTRLVATYEFFTQTNILSIIPKYEDIACFAHSLKIVSCTEIY